MKKKIERQEKEAAMSQKNKKALITIAVFAVVFACWMGYAIWDSVENYDATKTNSSVATTEINLDGINDYLNELYSE